MLLLSIIYFFVTFLGDPTKEDISKSSDFSVVSAYMIADRNKTLKQILSDKSLFVPSPVKDLPWSFDPQAYWLHLTIRNHTDKLADLVAHFDNSMLDELDVYQLKSVHSELKYSRLGDRREVDPIQRFSPHFSFDTAANS